MSLENSTLRQPVHHEEEMNIGNSGPWRTKGTSDGLRALNAVEQIANYLRGQIVRGEIQPGEMLPPATTLAAQFNVSRPTLSGAIRILESEGLITVTAGARGGALARRPDLSVAARAIGLYLQVEGTTVEDLLEARSAFEPQCARFLAERCSDEGLAQLTRCVALQQEAITKGFNTAAEFAAWAELAAEFHTLVGKLCGNKTLGAQAAALSEVFAAYRRVGQLQRKRSNLPLEDAHYVLECFEKLLDLIHMRDADGAEQHWRQYLLRLTTLETQNRDVSAPIVLFD